MDFVDAKPSTSERLRGGEHVKAALVEEYVNDPPIRKRKGSPFIRTPLNVDSKYYSMNGERRGKVLIFNHIFNGNEKLYRQGTEEDVKRLYCTLPRLGFRKDDIFQFDDYRFNEIERVAIELKINKDLESSDCLMVFILTHGEEGDKLLANDGSYQLYEFLSHFTPTALPSMAGKPKVFVIQACRGNKHDRGVSLLTTANDAGTDSVSSTAITFSYPEYADFIISKSSHHGHISIRHIEKGSWLIQELCNVITNCDLETSSILDILTDTNDAVSKQIVQRECSSEGHDEKQVSSFYSTMTKRLYFRKSQGSILGQAFSKIASNFCPAFAMTDSKTDGNTVCGEKSSSQDENSVVKRSTRAKRRRRQMS